MRIEEITGQRGISVELPGREIPGLVLAVSQASWVGPHKEFILNYLLHFLHFKNERQMKVVSEAWLNMWKRFKIHQGSQSIYPAL